MDSVSQIRDSGPTHLLLVSNRSDREFSRLLLLDRERRNLGLLIVKLAIDAIAAIDIQQ